MALLTGAPSSRAQDSAAKAVFDRDASRVVKIEVIERQSGTKTSIGSGFAIGREQPDLLLTNFHVVADVVHEAGRYGAEAIDKTGKRSSVAVLAVDVVNDLALLRCDCRFERSFRVRKNEIGNGESLYALGNPYDLGLSVVVGTYNGRLEHSIDQKIHFTGSLNPGMSGGPAVDASGRLVGVNVATSGNQVSFLVPASAVTTLLDGAIPEVPPTDFRDAIAAQLTAFQARYTRAILEADDRSTALGAFRAPTRPAPFFNCWGDTLPEEDGLYLARVHECSTDDQLFISKRMSLSPVQLRHRNVETDKLGSARFYSLYSDFFEGNHSEKWGDRKDYGAFRCHTRFVARDDGTAKTALCARPYRAYPGLYDMVFKAALLGSPRQGLESALVLSAVTFDNGLALSRHHFESLLWND